MITNIFKIVPKSYHSGLIIFLLLVAMISIIRFYLKIIRPFVINMKAKRFSGLIEAGLCTPIIKRVLQSDGSYREKVIGYNFPEIQNLSGGVEIKFKEAKATKSYVESKLQIISNALGIDFVEVHELGQRHFRILKDQLPERAQLLRLPPFHSLQIGVDNLGQQMILDTKKLFSFFIGGSTGDGKTLLIASLLYSWLRSVKHDAEVVIFDSKGLDWNELKNNKRYVTKVFELNTPDALKSADDFLKKFLEEFHSSKKILAANNIVHYEDARERGIEIPLKRKILIFDEAGRYLQPNECSSQQEKELKQSLVNKVTSILAQCRVSGCPVIVSTQRVSKDEISVPYENFLTQIFANISKEMDSKYRAGKYFQHKLGQGIWTVRSSDFEATRVRTIFLPNAFSTPQEAELPQQKEYFTREQKTIIYENTFALAGLAHNISVAKARLFFHQFSKGDFIEGIKLLSISLGEDHLETVAFKNLFKAYEQSGPTQDVSSSSGSPRVDPTDSYKILKVAKPAVSKYQSSHRVLEILYLESNEVMEILVPMESLEDHQWIMKRIAKIRGGTK